MPGPVPLPPSSLINGRRYSYSSIEISMLTGGFAGKVIDIDELNYAEELDFAFRRGTSKLPLGSTAGTWEPQECSMSMGKSTFTQWITNIAALNGYWLGVNLLMTINYNDEGEPLTTDVITARISGHENGHAYGPDALHVLVKWKPVIPIVTNGIPSVL